MKFVFFGYDFMIASVQRLMADGHELLGIMSFPCDNVFNFNRQVRALAQHKNVPFFEEKPTQEHISLFLEKGAACFLSAGYLYKIPPIDEKKAFGMNFHPSLLPRGRGVMPTPFILTEEPAAAGMSVHKLTSRMDAGDILHQKPLKIHENEDVETLSARIAMHAPALLSAVMADLPGYWERARPQDEAQALYWPMPDDKMRTLNWSKPVKEIDKTGRAFGRYGALAHFDRQLWVVYHYNYWPENHAHEPGTVVCRMSREVIIAARDGFVCLKEFQPVHSP